MKKKKKVLAIVAHPDDEIIWMGGTLIKRKDNWDTTIISLCRKSDQDRAPKFKRVCNFLNAKCHIFDLEDTKLIPLKKNEIGKIILKCVDKKSYDYVFTHGKNGEYGHIRHKEVHEAVKNLIKAKNIIADKVFFFSYIKKENDFQGYAVYNPKANIFINLGESELLLKKKLIKEVYGFQEGGFEEASSAKIEAFDKFIK